MANESSIKSTVERTLMPSEATEREESLKKRIRVVVVTPERAVMDATAEMVILPLYDGELGVLPGRAPLIGRLGAGELRLKNGGSVQRLFVEAGFVQVQSNVVTVLTAASRPASDVTIDLATQAAAEAEAMPASNAVERANKTKARDRAQGMRKVATKNGNV
jgi:F-type H+-transporting ATPase subunit epsilon